MLVKDIEVALRETRSSGKSFGGTTLSEGALVHLCRRIEPNPTTCRLVELGSGASTLFWSRLRELELLNIEVITLEHETSLVSSLKEELQEESPVQLYQQTLKQVSDEEWATLFASPTKAASLWETCGKPVPVQHYRNYTIPNTFYAQANSLPLDPSSVDVLIVDGPHGNGRSLAFPLFSQLLKPDALVLIDDYDHYPFLDHLGSVYRYEEVHLESEGNNRWSLVRLNGLRA